MSHFAPLAAIGVFALVVLFGACFVGVILSPVSRLAARAAPSRRIYVADFFSLTVVLSLPFAYLAAVRVLHGPDSPLFVVVGSLLCLTLAFVWWRSCVALSQLGISHAPRRWLFVGVLVPVALLGAICAPAIVIYSIATLATEPSVEEFAAAVAGLVAVPITAWLGRVGTRWVLGGRAGRR